MDRLNFELISTLKKKVLIIKEILSLHLYQGKYRQSRSNMIIVGFRPEKNVFRLRKDIRKNVTVALQQIRGYPLNIER